jgi:lipopolysaccharide/colanic/teichoic acid biosynthesis glycosyltransferase
VLDYAIALPSLLLLAPLFILLTILVKLDSPGPVFYRRRVLGQDGRVFDAFKFRTMHVNGDEIWPATQTAPGIEQKLQTEVRSARDACWQTAAQI